MSDHTLKFYVYTVDKSGRVIYDPSPATQTVTITDRNGDGLLQDKEMKVAFPEGHLLGDADSYFTGPTGTTSHGGTFYSLVKFDSAASAQAALGQVRQRFTIDPALVCFAAGTMIDTDRGPVAVETLQPGDLVRTRDNGLQPVRWTGSRTLGAAALAAVPQLRAIRIRAGALGDGTPSADLVVSPQHRVLVRSKIAQRMFGTAEVLVAAKQLLQLDGIDVAEDLDAVTYVHFLCDDHEIVTSNGAETETLYTGAEALKAVGPAAAEEIFALFPQLRDRDPEVVPVPARVVVAGRPARRLAMRHARNGAPVVSGP